MGNHKRGKPKNARAGCLMCKPHKSNAFKDCLEHQTIQERKAIEDEADQITEMFECTLPVTGGRGTHVTSLGGSDDIDVDVEYFRMKVLRSLKKEIDNESV